MMLKLLIAEDEEIIRKGLVMSPAWPKYDCVVVGAARDGVEGLELIRKEHPDIVLADIRMPRMDGIRMIREGLKDWDFYSIILTSYSEFELARQAIQVGVSAYLLKPVDEDELAETLEELKKKIQHAMKSEQAERISQDPATPEDGSWQVFELAKHSTDYYVRETWRMVRDHYQEKLSINDIAEALEISASFLSRRLKKTLNVSFVDLLNQYRIWEAIALLKQGNRRIYEISDLTGFSDYKYFCSVFKKYTGCSPTRFIQNGEATARPEAPAQGISGKGESGGYHCE